jgi:hypothetical protein
MTKRIVALMAAALLADAAVETVANGSPVRWWIAGAAVLYASVTAATWRRPIGWKPRLTIALAFVLAPLAATAWLNGGLTDGVRAFGQTTPRVLVTTVAAGIAVACAAVFRENRIPIALRLLFAALAAYGILAFATGAIGGATLPALLRGASLWQRLPIVLQGAFVGGLVVLPLALAVSLVGTGLRRPRGDSTHADVWRLAAIATSLAIVLAAIPHTASSRPDGPFAGLVVGSPSSVTGSKSSPTELNAALANSLRAVEDGERDAPRDRWDPAYVASKLGADSNRLFAWVRTNTFWVPYRGLLRGPAGVLMDRLGNGLDRAVLLATLLKHSNKSARLAHGSLSHEQAVDLLPRALGARARPARRASAPANDERIAAVAGQYQLDLASLKHTWISQSELQAKKRALLQARVPDQARRLAAVIGREAGERPESLTRAIDALLDHWWVQIREADSWRDFDLFGGPDGSALTTANETFGLDDVSADLHHRIVVRVLAEQWTGRGLTERVAFDRTLNPEQVMGMPILLQFTPLRAPTQPPLTSLNSLSELRTVALDVHEWVPVLTVGGSQLAQSAILDTGDVAKPGAEELVKTAGRDTNAFATAAGDLFKPAAPAPASPADAAPSKTLTAVWIEYEIRVPGAPAQKIRRAVFDLLGPAARGAQPSPLHLDQHATLSRSLALMMATEILPITCRFAPQYLVHLAAASLLANRELLAALTSGELSDDFAHVQAVSKRLAPLPTPLYGLARARFDWSRSADDIFIDRPNILTRHVFFSAAAKGLKLQDATDIVANEIGVYPTARDPFAIRIEQGVLDTNAEAILLSDSPDAANPGWAFETSRAWTAVSAANDSRLGAVAVSDDVRRQIAADLDAGYLVVAPTAPIAIGGDAFAGWWRVDPATGHVLGLGRGGWGQSMVERAMLLVSGAVAAFFFSYLWCAGRAGASQSAALDYLFVPVSAAGSVCLVDAIESAVAAFLIGLIGPFFDGGGSWGNQTRPGSGRNSGGGGPEGEPPPDLSDTQPDLGDTLPGDPPSVGGRSGGARGGGGGNGGGRSGGGGEPSEDVPQSARDAADAWRDANRRFWSAERDGDVQAQMQAIRDQIAANKAFPEGWTHVRGNPTPIIHDQFGLPEFGPPYVKPSSPPPPPCVGPGCVPSTSPMAKSVGGIGGTLNVVNKAGGK